MDPPLDAEVDPVVVDAVVVLSASVVVEVPEAVVETLVTVEADLDIVVEADPVELDPLPGAIVEVMMELPLVMVVTVGVTGTKVVGWRFEETPPVTLEMADEIELKTLEALDKTEEETEPPGVTVVAPGVEV